jgi:hypothetical protein
VNCGIDDESMGDILEGIKMQANFNELIIGSHEVGEKVIAGLSHIFEKKKLQTLKFIDC